MVVTVCEICLYFFYLQAANTKLKHQTEWNDDLCSTQINGQHCFGAQFIWVYPLRCRRYIRLSSPEFNLVAPGIYEGNFKSICKLILRLDILSTSNDISPMWVLNNPIIDNSRLVQVMYWCRPAKKHLLSQF